MTERDDPGVAHRAQRTGGEREVTSVPEAALDALARALPDRINADPEHVENGLARLVLTVIELLREILEHQAIRRMEGGTLSDEQVERLGLALLRLSERMEELKETFGLTDEDLDIDLGPLGRLR
jgi:Gas vesicle protein K